ncbi:helix-turn-helix transcriptional regulator [Ruegeria pomeroyi]|nr:AraC family transcriptional regulator [Ruegeria pomeroyi]NVK96758.1 AraC family transcriptional regulator ligand-binding domain-containing protein [Ruegeria pomeroyi]NVK99975.1 AraC family transcriptional regulator ligand-binding domain-containing protein [Ruegeria pomeroyi]
MQNTHAPVTPCGWLVAALLEAGVPLAEIEAWLGQRLPPDHRDRTVLPSEQYFRLFEWGAGVTANPDLGIQIAAHLTSRDFGLLGYLLENSDSLGTWLHHLTTYNAVFSQDAEISVMRAQGSVVVGYSPVPVAGFTPLQDIWSSIGMIVHAIRVATRCDWYPARCRFSTPCPADTSALEALLGPELHFDHKTNQIELPVRDLDLAIPGADPVLLEILKRQADGIVATLRQQEEIVSRLRLMITAHLAEGGFDTVRAARALNMSVRKLHRTLAERGTSFRNLRNEVLGETARAHLADPGIQITEIAHRLGFSETSAFTRAFKALEGMTPRDFRARSLGKT